MIELSANCNFSTWRFYIPFESAIIEFMPRRKVCRLRVFEFLVFFFSSSSLKIFALSTINVKISLLVTIYDGVCSLTWGSFTCVVASGIKEVRVKLIFKKLTDRRRLRCPGSTHNVVIVAVWSGLDSTSLLFGLLCISLALSRRNTRLMRFCLDRALKRV